MPFSRDTHDVAPSNVILNKGASLPTGRADLRVMCLVPYDSGHRLTSVINSGIIVRLIRCDNVSDGAAVLLVCRV